MTGVVAVFGGSQGIGRAVASKFIRVGYDVAILSRNNNNREEAIATLEKDNVSSAVVKCKELGVKSFSKENRQIGPHYLEQGKLK